LHFYGKRGLRGVAESKEGDKYCVPGIHIYNSGWRTRQARGTILHFYGKRGQCIMATWDQRNSRLFLLRAGLLYLCCSGGGMLNSRQRAPSKWGWVSSEAEAAAFHTINSSRARLCRAERRAGRGQPLPARDCSGCATHCRARLPRTITREPTFRKQDLTPFFLRSGEIQQV